MIRVDLAEAKHRLDELVEDVSNGQVVEITDDGKTVARLVPAEASKKPIDITALQSLTAKMPTRPTPAGTFVRELRDSERY